LIDAIQSFEGKEINITIEKAKKQRSNCQNAYYWGIVIVILKSCLKSTGNNLSDNDVHDLLRLKFLKETISIKEETGEVIERVKSTTELTTTQFMDYIAEIQQFSAEYFDVIIPDPNSEITLNFDN
jgi:hypothetical protein